MAKTAVRKVKRLPQRSCISCQRTLAKRELVRVVRTVTGEVVIDRTGKVAGRGAYLCPMQECWASALRQGRIEHALHVSLSEADLGKLQQFALQLPHRDQS